MASKRSSFGYIRPHTLKSGAKSYTASFVDPITRKRVSRTFRAQSEARKWLNIRKKDIMAGQFRSPDKQAPPLPSPTVKEVTDQWLKDLRARGRKESTLYTYDSKIKHPLAELGKTRLDEITPEVINQYCVKVQSDLPPGAASNALAKLHAILAWAAKQGMIDRVIIDRASWPVIGAVKDPERRQVATPEEVRIMAQAMPPKYALVVYLAAWCALRMGEVRGLQRKDFQRLDEPGKAVVQVRRQVNSKMHHQYTDLKTKAGKRDVTIPSTLIPLVKEQLHKYVDDAPDAVLFPSPTVPDRPIGDNRLREHFWVARAKAKMPWFVFHDLRHTGLTIFAQQGATLAELLERGGHSDVEVALRYQHATIERDQTLTAKMDSAIIC